MLSVGGKMCAVLLDGTPPELSVFIAEHMPPYIPLSAVYCVL